MIKQLLVFIKVFSAIFFIGISWEIKGQSIKILDHKTTQPIPYVLIYNESKSASTYSDLNGEANLAAFGENESITFQHPSYITLTLLKNEIEALNFQILLKEDVISMKEVVVSANKWEQDRTEIPNKIVSVTGYDIQFNNPQTAADVLEKSGQVFVQKSQLGGGSPMIRGFAANSVLIVVEGVRMNNAIFRSGNLQNVINIDPNILEGAEVLFGPGSVIYGSDALGGVMDFHFQDPRFNTKKEWNASGSAFTRYSSANNEKTGHIDVNLFSQKFSSLTSFSFSDFDDLRTGSNRTDEFPDFGKRPWYVQRQGTQDIVVPNDQINTQVPSAYSQWNVLQKFSYKPSAKLKLNYTLNYSNTSDLPRYDRLIETSSNGDPKFAQWYYGPQEWLYTTLRTEIERDKGMFDQGKIILGYQAFEESRNDRRFNNSNLRQRTEEVDAYSVNIDFEKTLDDKSRLFYGAEIIKNDIESTGQSLNIDNGTISPASTRYPDGGTDYSSIAIYASYKRTLFDTWNFTGGVRFSQFKLESKFIDTTFFDFPFQEVDLSNGAFNGSLGLTHTFGAGWQINGLFSTGFRAPNLDDVGKIFDSEPGIVVVPNPDLEPEFSYNFEASLSKIVLEKTRIDAVIYYSILRDAMVRRPFTFDGQDSIVYDGTLSRVEALVNTGEAYVFGWSVNFRSQITPTLVLNGAITYSDGRDKSENIPLRHTTPVFGDLGLTWRKGKFKAQALMKFNGKREFDDLPPSEQNKTHLYTTDGSLAWYTLNANFAYNPNNHWQITTAFENILDKHYRPYSSGISAPGFNWIIGIRARF